MAHVAPNVAERFDGSARTPRSLEERVRELQIKDKIEAKKSGGAALWLPWILCGMMLFVTLSVGWQAYLNPGAAKARSPGAANGDKKSNAASNSTAADTGSEPVASGTLVLETRGYIVPAHQIQVSPIEVAGRIKEIKFEEGQWFEQGQELAKIDDVLFAAEVREAKAMVALMKAKRDEIIKGFRDEEKAQSRAELEEAKAMLVNFGNELKRLKAGRERGAANEKELDLAIANEGAQSQRVKRLQAAYDMMMIGHRDERKEAAEAELQQAEARLRRAEWRLENCIIRAPVSGNILTKKAEVGNLVSPMSFNVSSSLCEMADLTKLEVDLEVQEREIGKVELGQKCKVRCDAYPKRTWDGEVVRIMPVALRAKSAVQVRVRVLNIPKEEAGKFLRPDMNSGVTFYAK